MSSEANPRNKFWLDYEMPIKQMSVGTCSVSAERAVRRVHASGSESHKCHCLSSGPPRGASLRHRVERVASMDQFRPRLPLHRPLSLPIFCGSHLFTPGHLYRKRSTSPCPVRGHNLVMKLNQKKLVLTQIQNHAHGHVRKLIMDVVNSCLTELRKFSSYLSFVPICKIPGKYVKV